MHVLNRSATYALVRRCSGPTPLLEWALPLLQAPQSDPGGTSLALSALAEFSIAAQGSPPAEAAAGPILEACQRLLEDEATPSALLHPLVRLLTAIAQLYPVPMLRLFDDVSDLLLGWALEPELEGGERELLLRCFLGFHKQWAHRLPLGTALLGKLVEDLVALTRDSGDPTAPGLRRMQSLAACFCAILQGCGPALQKQAELVGPLLEGWLGWGSAVVGQAGEVANSGAALACQGLCVFGQVLQQSLAVHYFCILTFMEAALALPSSTALHLCGLLRPNLQLLTAQGVALPMEAVTRLLRQD